MEAEFRTYEQISLDKLKEIEPATRKQWSTAMGYGDTNAFQTIIRRCERLNLVVVNKTKQPYIYRVKRENEV